MEAYFDIFSGISGNMVLGAMMDLGLDRNKWEEELKKLGLEDEYEIEVKEVTRQGITGTFVEVKLHDEHGHIHGEHEDAHSHHHGRHLPEIEKLIEESGFSDKVIERSKAIFNNLARAEAKIHGTEIDKIHFHEVGAVDAIIDIVGSVLAIEMLGIESIVASPLHTGRGFVHCEHGKMPVPAPATMEILKNVPVYSEGIEKELVTPTGAAIITTLARSFGSRPEMEITKTGYGAGSRELEIPNLLRVNLGEFVTQKKTQ